MTEAAPLPPAPVQYGRRWLVGSAAVGTMAVLTGVLSLASRPVADVPTWWPASLCLAGATVMTPAKARRAQRRERGKLRAAAEPTEPQ